VAGTVEVTAVALLFGTLSAVAAVVETWVEMAGSWQ
jgi:hypothetical protein